MFLAEVATGKSFDSRAGATNGFFVAPGDKLSNQQMDEARLLMMTPVDYNCGMASQSEIKKNVKQVVKDMYILNDMGFKAEEYASKNFQVINNKFDSEIMKMNTFRAELNTKYLEQIQKDLYIGEAYNILTDYINSK